MQILFKDKTIDIPVNSSLHKAIKSKLVEAAGLRQKLFEAETKRVHDYLNKHCGQGWEHQQSASYKQGDCFIHPSGRQLTIEPKDKNGRYKMDIQQKGNPHYLATHTTEPSSAVKYLMSLHDSMSKKIP